MSTEEPQTTDTHSEFIAMAGDLRSRPKWLLEMVERGDLEGLVKTLRGPYPEFAADAAWGLGSLGKPESVPHLVEALEHADAPVRRSAAEALGVVGDLRAAPALRKLLKDEDADVRGIAVWALGGVADPECVTGLVALLGDGELFTDGLGEKELIGWQAAHTLSMFGDLSFQPLVKATSKKDPMVRRNAAMALGYMGLEDAVRPLVELLSDKNTEVRRAALNALGDLGHPVEVDPIHPLLSDPSEEVRWSAVLLLGNLEDQTVNASLLEALTDSSAEVVSLAAGALAARNAAEAVPALMKLLDDGGKKAAAAARALGALGAAGSVPRMLQMLDKGGNEERAAAAASLGQLKAKEAVDKLKQLLMDPSPSVRGEVLGALRAITGLTFGEEKS
ncbi:MAG: HEAT repeat domain-containing protein [Candidatus Wallbacteria bacterium]|nr:HEAT repeat domain-containing protein [Candidatus Wallbacteria bacterium]